MDIIISSEDKCVFCDLVLIVFVCVFNCCAGVCPCSGFALWAGAFGYFEVTHDISKYCKAAVFYGILEKILRSEAGSTWTLPNSSNLEDNTTNFPEEAASLFGEAAPHIPGRWHIQKRIMNCC